jgi:K+-transporting ATPase ATPase C chain
MLRHLRANVLLLVLTVLLCSVLYPLVILAIGQTLFRDRAEGDLLEAATPKGPAIVGARLIGQPFSQDEYFWPRPSAAGSGNGYDASASSPSNYAASNYLLRDRVARQLGPIVKYRSGPKQGQPVAADVESWFQKDRFRGRPGIVAQWAKLHPTVAQNWVKNDMTGEKYGLCGQYVAEWQKTHAADVAAWIKENRDTPQPKPEDLTGPFFTSFSQAHPGMFPSAVEHKTPDGKTEKRIEPVKEGSDIQSGFFDMWLEEHPDVDLEPVPADMVTSSGSGLDPHITLENAHWQLRERVAAAWAKKTGRSEAEIRGRIEDLLREQSFQPMNGLVGVSLVNVLEVNQAVQELAHGWQSPVTELRSVPASRGSVAEAPAGR